jgi:hypothetical protein
MMNTTGEYDKENYQNDWLAFRKRRKRLAILLVVEFLGFLPFVGLVVTIEKHFFSTARMTFPAAFFWGALYLFTGSQLRRFPCPRCGKNFFGSVFARSGDDLRGQRCAYCGLQKYAELVGGSENPPLPKKARSGLLTTRLITGIAVAITAVAFARSVRTSIRISHNHSGWLLPSGVMLHGRALLIANLVMYAYMCWLGYWIIRSTKGRERIFMSGWFVPLLLSPLVLVSWLSQAVQFMGSMGLLIALGAAASLLMRPERSNESELDHGITHS